MTTKAKWIVGSIACCFLLYLCSGPSEADKRAQATAEVDAAIAANRYQAQQFNSDRANVDRFAEGFAKGAEGDIAGIARDLNKTYQQQSQLEENERQLQAYRANLNPKKKESGGFFSTAFGFIILICIGAGIYDRFKPQSKPPSA